MTDSENAMTVRTRRGRMERTIATATKDAEAARLRAQSLPYRDIAEQLGYASPSGAHTAVQRALRAVVEEPAEDVRRLEMEKLDALERAALAIATVDRTVVSNGRVTDVPDDGPRLQALALLMRIGESRRKLLGLDQPAKVTVDGGVRYEVVGVDLAALT